MPPTKHMTGDVFRGYLLDGFFNLVGAMTGQGILLVGMMTEAVVTPFLSDRDLTVGVDNQVHPTVWYRIIVRNVGGRAATSLSLVDSMGRLPRDSDCPRPPDSLGPDATYTCFYSRTFSAQSTVQNSATVDSAETPAVSTNASVRIEMCSSPRLVVPNLVEAPDGDPRTVAEARSVWTGAGFTGRFTPANGSDNRDVVEPGPRSIRLSVGEHGRAGDARVTRSHHARSTDGQSLVEFALAFPIFLLLLFGLIDIGRFVYTANAVSQAAREGARYGSVGDWSASCGGSRQSCVIQETIDRLAGVTVKPSDVKVTCWRHLMSDPSKPVSSVPDVGLRCE